jgi:hypothetical protein
MPKKSKQDPAVKWTPTLQKLIERLSPEEIETGILKQRTRSPEFLESLALEEVIQTIRNAQLERD